MPQRTFTPEFKLAVASKVVDEGMTIHEACDTFNIGRSTASRWVQQLRKERTGDTVPQARPITQEQRRIRELEQENKRLKEERDILKKATAFFVREQTGKQWFFK